MIQSIANMTGKSSFEMPIASYMSQDKDKSHKNLLLANVRIKTPHVPGKVLQIKRQRFPYVVSW